MCSPLPYVHYFFSQHYIKGTSVSVSVISSLCCWASFFSHRTLIVGDSSLRPIFTYSGMSGTSARQAQVALTSYYRVHVQPKQGWLLVDGTKHPMSAGMTVTVDIRTGQRRVLDFFLDPVLKYISSGLRVR